MAGNATAGTHTTPSSYGSVVNNGQLVGVQTRQAYFPKAYGGGIAAVPASSPVTIPPAIGYGMGTIPTGSNRSSAAPSGQSNYSKFSSPAVWAIGLMAFGVLWLRFIHWRKIKPTEHKEE